MQLANDDPLLAGPGHNEPPIVERLTQEVDVYVAICDDWKGTPITDANAAALADFIDQGLKKKNAVADAFKAEKEPILLAGREVGDRYRSVTDKIEVAVKFIKSVMEPYALARKQRLDAEKAERKRVRKEKERDAREAAERTDREDSLAAEIAATEAARAADAAIRDDRAAHESSTVRGDLARKGVGIRNVRLFRITDPDQVPRAFCVPSEALIREAINRKDGPELAIAGVAIWDDTRVQ